MFSMLNAIGEISNFNTQKFHPCFPCFEKRSILTFFVHKVLTLRATFDEKMKKFEDDVF